MFTHLAFALALAQHTQKRARVCTFNHKQTHIHTTCTNTQKQSTFISAQQGHGGSGGSEGSRARMPCRCKKSRFTRPYQPPTCVRGQSGLLVLGRCFKSPPHFLLVGTLPSSNVLGTLPCRNFVEFQNTCARCLVVQALPLKRKP